MSETDPIQDAHDLDSQEFDLDQVDQASLHFLKAMAALEGPNSLDHIFAAMEPEQAAAI